MTSNVDDFMLEEYRQIAQAFFALHTQRNQLLRYYLTLMTIGVSIVSVCSQAIPTVLSQAQTVLNNQLLGMMILFLFVMGMIIFIAIIGVRHDMLFYARTINSIRRYFQDKNPSVKSYLILPTSNQVPSFWEKPLKYFFWEVSSIAVANSFIAVMSSSLLIALEGLWLLIVFVLCLFFHELIYGILSALREREFRK
ncbi:MAG: hypothetical protein QXW82_06595 [Candidatus Bathyarchaeia archaeon]